MSNRITDANLQAICDTLNRITGSPMTPWSMIDGKNVANIGNYHLSGAYGGKCIHRICNESGGVTAPIVEFHVPKRELYDRAWSFIRGIELGQQLAKQAETVEA